MTEQEKKEIVNILCNACDINCDDLTYKVKCCDVIRSTEALYNAGYRRADDLIAENKKLKQSIKEYDTVLNIFNNRKYRKKFIKEIWKGEMGETLSTPDGDFIYQLYFDLRKENKRLKQNYDKVYDIKCGLENELIERGWAEYALGDFKVLSDEERDAVRKETAKEILTKLLSESRNVFNLEEVKHYADIPKQTIYAIAEEYDIECGKTGFDEHFLPFAVNKVVAEILVNKGYGNIRELRKS